MNSADPSYLQSGTVLASRYCIESMLGQGGMGAVYLGRVESLDKPVAIKEMRVQAGDARQQQQAVEQFRQEAYLLAHLDHPNLVQVTDYFAEGQRYYLVMSYVKGQNLFQQMQARRAAFPPAQVLDWGLQLTSVLGYLHSQQPAVLFRDLKPSNIMIDGAGKVRLIDFGIARSFNPDEATQTFLQGVGSPGYSPLEQYHGAGGTDPRSDIYALGATLFYLLTAQVPPSSVELVSQGSGPPSAHKLNPGVPPALDRVICKMMGLRKDDRFQTMQQVHTVLEQISTSLQSQDRTENLAPVANNEMAYFSEGGRTFPIQHSELVIGRQAPAELVFAYPQISRQHIRLVRTPKGYTVVDLGSRFGSFVNGRAVGTEPVPLQDGDELVLGGVLSLRFCDPSQTQGGKKLGRLKGVWIDADSQDVWLDGQQLAPPLSSAQLTLLKLLEQRPGAFVTREEVVQAVWPESSSEGVSEEAVDGLIKRVRARLREAGRDPIEVRRGHGLRLLS